MNNFTTSALLQLEAFGLCLIFILCLSLLPRIKCKLGWHNYHTVQALNLGYLNKEKELTWRVTEKCRQCGQVRNRTTRHFRWS